MALRFFLLCLITSQLWVITKFARGIEEPPTQPGPTKEMIIGFDSDCGDTALLPNETYPFHGEGPLLEFPGKEPLLAQQAAAPRHLWPNNTFYYEISNQYCETYRNLILRAIDHLAQEVSCLKFVDWGSLQTPDKSKYHHAYISNGHPEGECDAEFAYWPWDSGKPQKINLGRCCMKRNTIGAPEHEILHALGVSHQHQRHDRDMYVNIYWNKIKQDKFSNFHITKLATHGLPYDVSSLMHYPNDAFSNAVFGLSDTMDYKNDKNVCLGQGIQASDCDLELLRHMYGCPLKNNCRSDTLKFNYKKKLWFTFNNAETCEHHWEE